MSSADDTQNGGPSDENDIRIVWLLKLEDKDEYLVQSSIVRRKNGRRVWVADHTPIDVDRFDSKAQRFPEEYGSIEDIDIDDIRPKIRKKKYIQDTQRLAPDGGDTSDSSGGNLFERVSVPSVMPIRTAEQIVSGAAERLRAVYSSCEAPMAPIKNCCENQREIIEADGSRGVGQGAELYYGPIHAYARVRPLRSDIPEDISLFKHLSEEKEYRYQRRSPINIIWKNIDIDKILEVMENNGWRERFLTPARWVVLTDTGGERKIQNNKQRPAIPTSEQHESEKITKRVIRKLDTAQYHVRLFDLSEINRIMGYGSKYDYVVGQAHYDPWHHDIPPRVNCVTFKNGRNAVRSVWQNTPEYDCTNRAVANKNKFNNWDGSICEVVPT